MTGRLDPDTLAALEEERDFLLRSLDDLEAEHAAGDLDTVDFESLKDDYTRRAADVLRAIEEQRTAFAEAPGIGWRRTAAWVVGLAVLGAIAGLLLARTTGERLEGDSITGGVRASVGSRLSQAQQLFADPDDWDDAIALYAEILEEAPTNVEALTYDAWLRYRSGAALDEVLPAWEEVRRIDDSYPDGIVFHAIALSDVGRYVEAADVLDALDLETAPPAVQQIVTARGLRGEVYGEARYDLVVATDRPTLDALDLTPDVALEAATYVLGTDRVDRSVVSLKLLRAVSADDPENATALAREAFLLAQTGDPALLARARLLADRAVTAEPDNIEALVTRASLALGDDQGAACADLERVAELAEAVAGGTASAGLVTQAEALAQQLACP